MTPQKLFAAVLGGLVLAVAPLAVNAQSGDALAKAEHTCLDSGIQNGTPAYEVCVGRVAFALDRGDRDTALSEARAIGDARDACSSYGIAPQTLQYRQCLANELDRRIAAPGPAVTLSVFGFGYDGAGNLLDRDGQVIRPYGPGDGSVAEAR